MADDSGLVEFPNGARKPRLVARIDGDSRIIEFNPSNVLLKKLEYWKKGNFPDGNCGCFPEEVENSRAGKRSERCIVSRYNTNPPSYSSFRLGGQAFGLTKFLIARYYLAANFLLHLRMLNWGNDSANV